MDYDEASNATVCIKEAKAEVERHGCEFSEFIKDLGEHEHYLGGDVLTWLGY